MNQLKATIEITMLCRDGESFDDAADRLYDLLFDGLCRTADHEVDFWVVSTEGG